MWRAAFESDEAGDVNRVAPDYVDVSADDAREAVRSLQRNLPALTKALNSWFGRYDLGV
jgi:hypothetical protein